MTYEPKGDDMYNPAFWAAATLAATAVLVVAGIKMIGNHYASLAAGLAATVGGEAASKQAELERKDAAMARALAAGGADLPSAVNDWQTKRGGLIGRLGDRAWDYGREAFPEWAAQQVRARTESLSRRLYRAQLLAVAGGLLLGGLAAALVYSMLAAGYAPAA